MGLWFERVWTAYLAHAQRCHRYLVSLHTPTHHIARYLWLSALVCYWTRILRIIDKRWCCGVESYEVGGLSHMLTPYAHSRALALWVRYPEAYWFGPPPLGSHRDQTLVESPPM